MTSCSYLSVVSFLSLPMGMHFRTNPRNSKIYCISIPHEIFRFATSLGIPINYNTYQRTSEEKPCIDRGNPFCPHPRFQHALKASATRYLSQGSSTRGGGFFLVLGLFFCCGCWILDPWYPTMEMVENLKSGPNKS